MVVADSGISDKVSTCEAPNWLFMVGLFIAVGQVWGHCYSYSVLYNHLVEERPEQEIHISVIGSILFCLTLGGTLLIAPIMRYVTLRWVYFGCMTLFLSGFIASAFFRDFRFWYLTYSLPVGVGTAGVNLCAAIAILRRFPKRVTGALVTATTGVGVFTFVNSFAMEMLLRRFGTKYSLLIIAACLVLLLLLTPIFADEKTEEILVQASDKCKISRSALSLNTGSISSINEIEETAMKIPTIFQAITTKDFFIWVLASILISINLSMPYVHLTHYTHSLIKHPLASPTYFSFSLGCGSILGKTMTAVVVDKFKVPVLLAIQFICCTHTFSLCVLGLLSYMVYEPMILIGLYTATLGLGAADGSLWPLTFPATYLTTGSNKDPVIFSIYMAIISIPCVLGGPMASKIYEKTKSYPLAFFFGGLIYMLAINILWMSSKSYFSTGQPQILLNNVASDSCKSLHNPLIVEKVEQKCLTLNTDI